MKCLLITLLLAPLSFADCPAQQTAPARQRVTVRETVYEPAQEAPRLLIREAPVYREVRVAAPAAPLYFVPVAPVKATVYRGPLGRVRKVVVEE